MTKNSLWRTFFYALLAVNIVAVVGLWWTASGGVFRTGSVGELIALGRLAGLLLECSILLMLLLVARIPILERAFGFDRMNKLHRVIGYSIAALFVLHPTLLTLGYARSSGSGLIHQFLDFFYNWEDVAFAVIGVLLFLFVIVTTVLFRKYQQYEVWHGIHLLNYVSIVLVFLHQTNFGDISSGAPLWRWLALNFTVFALFIFYRFIHPLLLWNKHRFMIREVRQESPDAWSVVMGGRDLRGFRFEAGQFAQWFFLEKGFVLPHPFSFSAAPNGETLRVTPKAVGDFTKRIRELKPGTPVIIDGPLGRFTAAAAHRDTFLLIAGGIGITPICALSEELARKNKDAVLLYSAKTAEDFALMKDIPQTVRAYQFVSEGEVPAGHEKGRIDIDAIRRLVPDFKEREIYICGPQPMMDALEVSLRAAGLEKKYIHIERFAF